MAPTVAATTSAEANAEAKGTQVQKNAKGFKIPRAPTYDSLEEERQAKKERLALAYRVFAYMGFDEGIAGHLTCRDPILKDHFWVNPFGRSFSEMCVSDLLLIAPDGSVAMGGKPGDGQLLNSAAFAIHEAIHMAREDVDAACHSHSLYGKAWATLGRNVEITTQDSCMFYKDCALYSSFGGVVLASEEAANIVRALGPTNHSLILQNHGLLTCGGTIEAAVFRFIALEKHCQVMLLAEPAAAARGGKMVEIGEEEAAFTHRAIANEPLVHFQAKAIFEKVHALTKGAYKE